MLLDGDGTFRHWEQPGTYSDQPWLDMQIYQAIRERWCQLRNADMESRIEAARSKAGPRVGR